MSTGGAGDRNILYRTDMNWETCSIYSLHFYLHRSEPSVFLSAVLCCYQEDVEVVQRERERQGPGAQPKAGGGNTNTMHVPQVTHTHTGILKRKCVCIVKVLR